MEDIHTRHSGVDFGPSFPARESQTIPRRSNTGKSSISGIRNNARGGHPTIHGFNDNPPNRTEDGNTHDEDARPLGAPECRPSPAVDDGACASLFTEDVRTASSSFGECYAEGRPEGVKPPTRLSQWGYHSVGRVEPNVNKQWADGTGFSQTRAETTETHS